MSDRDLVFFSYRHEDERWLDALRGMLEPFVLGQSLIAWSDKDIRVGARWHGEIQGAIGRTRVAVLLVSQRFFGSSYIRDFELPRLVQDAGQGLLTLVCIPVGPFDASLCGTHGLAAFQFAFDPAKALNEIPAARRERRLVEVATKIKDAYGAQAAPVARRETTRKAEAALEASGAGGGPAAPGALFDVPPLDARHVTRPEELAAIRRHLLEGHDQALGLTSAAPGLGLHGMGGMGKTTMAQALCHDDALRRAFPDGIAWVTLGQQPDLLDLQNRLLRRYEPEVPPASTIGDAAQRLRERLQGLQMLLVVDDVWDARHFRSGFDVVRGRSRLLLTTRDATVLSQAGARSHAVQRLPREAGLRLLSHWVHVEPEALPPEAAEVVEATAGLPLALALAGAQVADGVEWTTLLDQLRQGRIDFLDHPYSSVYASLGRSVDFLPPGERKRYVELAVFPEDTPVPFEVVARLWRHTGGLREAASEQLLARFDRKALLSCSGSGTQRQVSLHDLQHDFVRLRADDLAALHGRLLDAYRQTLGLAEGASGWAGLPRQEPYLWRHLASHLIAAGRVAELESALIDRGWIRARLDAATRLLDQKHVCDLAAVRKDFEAAPLGSSVRLVGRSLRASAHVLSTRPDDLDWQLFGRLGHSSQPELKTLGQSALTALRSSRGWWTPSRPALAPPGALLETTPAGASPNGALLLPDGRRALSWSHDRTLRLWDLDAGGAPAVLEGHEDWVNGTLLLPDGHRALSWSDDRTLRLWDLDAGGAPTVLQGHEDSVNGARLLPDGRRALSWSDDRTLRLWDLDAGGAPTVLQGHEDSVCGALLLPDGRRALSWSGGFFSNDHSLRLWDLDAGGAPAALQGHEDLVTGALLLPDGHRALSWSDDRSLRLWDLDAGGAPAALQGHEDLVTGALLLPDGHRALSWSDDCTLRLWDLDAGGAHTVLKGHLGSVLGACLLPDGRRTLSWSHDCTLRLWDLDAGSALTVLEGHESSVLGALLLPDGRRALSVSDDRTLRLWDLDAGGAPTVLQGHEDSVYGALLLPDGRRALSWSRDSTLRLWDLDAGGAPAVHNGRASAVRGALQLADSRRALSWSWDGTLRLWDLDADGAATVLEGDERYIYGALLLPDGHRALCWASDYTLRLWNLDATAPTVLEGHAGHVNGALVLSDGRRALSWSDDCTLRLWDLDAGGTPAVLEGHEGSVKGALLLPDGRRALSWSDDHTLRLWELASGGAHTVLVGHEGPVTSALLLPPDGRRALSWSSALSCDGRMRLWDLNAGGASTVIQGLNAFFRGVLPLPDGRRALSWSGTLSDGSTLRLWDLVPGGTSTVLEGHEGKVQGAALLPGGHRALSWSNDYTLRLWDLDAGGAPAVLQGHEDSVTGALLLPDGHRALSWSDDRTLRLWNLDAGREVARYDADAVIRVVRLVDKPLRVFIGDALGYVQVLRFRDP